MEFSALKNLNSGLYQESLREYLQLLKKDANNGFFNYQVAKCFLNMPIDKTRALPYLKIAYNKNDYKNSARFLFDLASVYSHSHQFDSALFWLNISELLPQSEIQLLQTQRLIETCLNAQALINSPLDVSFINLGKKINSHFSETDCFISKNEMQMFFSSNRSENFAIYSSNKKPNTDLWSKPVKLDASVNITNQVYMAGLSSEGKRLYAHFENVSNQKDIASFYIDDNNYIEQEKELDVINSVYNENYLTTSLSSDTLYFSSNRLGGFGGYDIYYSLRLPNGKWGNPVNMGSEINTSFDDAFPQLSPNGNKLYFASKGHNSMGGYDIFFSKQDSITSEWATPVNIGYPINDTYDNTTISFLENERYAYVSLIKPYGFGEYDIYNVIFNSIEPEISIFKANVFSADTFNLPEKIKKESPDFSITVYKQNPWEIFGKYSFDSRTGNFILALPPGNYELVIQGTKIHTITKQIEIKENLQNRKVIPISIQLQIKNN